MESVETRLAKSAGSRYSRAHRQTFYWTVNPRVVVGSVVDQLNVEGNAVSLAVTASEPGATLTFSATGLFIDPASGVISGTISESALTTVPYAVTVTVATFTNSDPNWSSWQFSATINWGDGTTSDVGAISGGNGSFTVSGNHVYARAGNYATSIAIADGFQTVTSAGTVAVSAAPIVVSGGFVQGAAVGIEVSATLASFTGNASALASGFIATISWGDTTSGVGTITGVNGKFVVNGRHTYASTGTYTVTVSVTDLDASTGSGNSTVQVGDVLAGIPATLTVATFRSNDPNATASQFSATIVWGDGTSSSGTITAMAGGVYTVQCTHKYAADGVYTVTTTVFGPYSESITASRSVTAKAPALTGYAENLAAKPGVSFNNVAVAEFIDPNQSDTSGSFTATINWGDGTSSTGTVSGANGVFEVNGGHTYATAGSYVVQVAVQQLRNSVVALALNTAAATVTVAAVRSEGSTLPPQFVKYQSEGDPDTPSTAPINIKWDRELPEFKLGSKELNKIIEKDKTKDNLVLATKKDAKGNELKLRYRLFPGQFYLELYPAGTKKVIEVATCVPEFAINLPIINSDKDGAFTSITWFNVGTRSKMLNDDINAAVSGALKDPDIKLEAKSYQDKVKYFDGFFSGELADLKENQLEYLKSAYFTKGMTDQLNELLKDKKEGKILMETLKYVYDFGTKKLETYRLIVDVSAEGKISAKWVLQMDKKE